MATSKKTTEPAVADDQEILSDLAQKYFNPEQYSSLSVIGKAHALASFAKDALHAILESDPMHNMLLIGTDSLMLQLTNRFAFLGGIVPEMQLKQEFPPITNFMGDEIKTPKKVEAADMDPDEEQLERYKIAVQSLYDQFDSLDPQNLLTDIRTDEQILELRGVAKLAGVEGFDSRDINITFLEDISAGIAKKKADEAEDLRINTAMLNKQKLSELDGIIKTKEAELDGIQSAINEKDSKILSITTDLNANKAKLEDPNVKGAAKNSVEKAVANGETELKQANDERAQLQSDLEAASEYVDKLHSDYDALEKVSA